MSERGRFIVLEGIDYAGKSTLVDRLLPAFLFMKEWAISTREPYDEPENEVGFNIRRILLGEKENPGYTELQKMFVLARKWHLDNIVIPALEEGKHVICDRYVASTYAYHRSKGGSFDEVRTWHYDCDCKLDADLTIYVRIPVEVSLERMKKRAEREIFDKEESLKAIASAYEQLLRETAEYVPNFRSVDGNRDISEVSWDIMDMCGEMIPGLDRAGANS